jgi:flagellar FliJ protein
MIHNMRFVYPFQQIVDLKTNEKKQAESELSQAIGVLTEAERELAALVLSRHQMQQQLADGVASGVPMSDLLVRQQYVEFLEERIRAARQKITSAERTVEVQRHALTERTVDEKVWLKAREKAKELFQSTFLKHAQNELDEIATVRSRTAR